MTKLVPIKTDVEHSKDAMLQLLTERLQGQEIKAISIDGDFFKFEFGNNADLRVIMDTTYLHLKKPL